MRLATATRRCHVRKALAAVGLVSSLMAPVAVAQQVPCEEWAIVAVDPRNNSRLHVCSAILREVPALRAQLDRLNAAVSSSTDAQRDLVKFTAALNDMAKQLKAQDANRLAASLAARIEENGRESDARLMREIDRLRLGMLDIQEKLDSARSSQQVATATRAAIAGPAGEAIGRLDLDAAKSILDGIGRIERKVDALAESVDLTALTTVLAEATRMKARGDLGQVAALGTLVSKGKTFGSYDFSGMGLSRVEAPALNATEASFTLTHMADANLTSANLERARLVAATIDRSDLSKANLRHARATLASANGTVLREANLSLSSWIAADLRRADLRSANLRGASLGHADLRGADLTDADLTGAFLGNADLRDAKLKGVVFSNTDVASALIVGTDLTDAQRAGLCATPPHRNQAWTIVEKIPSGKFSGGYEYRPIFDKRLYPADGSERPYSRCAANPERRSDDFSFGMDHALLNVTGRRQEVLGRAEAALKSAQDRQQHIRSLPQFATVVQKTRARLDERLRQLLENPGPQGPLYFDADTALLLILRLRPELLASLDVDWKTAAHGGFSEHLGRKDGQVPPRWPRLFPEDLLRSDLDDATAAVFERWTKARSRALPSNEVEISLGSGLRGRKPSWEKALVYASRYGRKDDRLAAAMSADPDQVVVYDVSLPVVAGTGKGMCAAFLVATDIESFRASLGAKAAKPARPGAEMATAVVTDVRVVPFEPSSGHPRECLVWHLKMKAS
jgi:uncharacterized protein YjbI with pentapeptide repeats